MSFKNNLLVLLLIPSLGFGFDLLSGYKPEIGAYYKYSRIKGRSSYAEFMPEDYNTLAAYIRLHFHPSYSMDISYEDGSTTIKRLKIGSGVTIFNKNTTQVHEVSIKSNINSLFFDFNVHFPIDYFTQLMATAGVGFAKPMIETSSNGGTRLDNAIQSLSAKKKMLLRLGVGGQYMVTDLMGIFSTLRYENTGAIKVQGNSAFRDLKFNDKVFENSASLALGVFVKI